MNRARVGRLIVMPVMVLLVAWGLSVTARQRETREIATIERAVTGWCQAAARGEEPLVPGALDLPPGLVVEALRSACRKNDRAAAWSIAVGKGPGDAPTGRASYHAMIRVDGVDDLGLLLGLRDGEALVLGYWLVP